MPSTLNFLVSEGNDIRSKSSVRTMTIDNPTEHRELPLLYEKRVGHGTDYDLAAYCDVHDLIATVSIPDRDIVVYRINGQVAFTIKARPNNIEPTVVKWKPDGSLVGVGWMDGFCGVYSGENGKLLSQTSTIAEQGQDIWKLDLTPDFETNTPTNANADGEDHNGAAVCIGWTAYAPPGKDSKEASNSNELPSTVDTLFEGSDHESRNGDSDATGHNKPGIRDLADSITMLDVTKVLQQLSAIPSHGARTDANGSKFAAQAGVDTVFETRKPASDAIDTLITSANAGYTNVLLNESVKIGSFDLRHRSWMHTSHPRCSSQVILTNSEQEGKFRLHYIDLPLNTLGSPLLHVVAMNTKKLQNLMAYVSQTIRCIQHDFQTGLQFPKRLMNNIEEELKDKEEGDLISNLYHLAMTGTFTPTMLAWLVDIVKETNHKRWDQAVSSMYANIRDHLFVNLSPALDRLSIAASALRGHARLHEGTSKFDVSPELFTTILDEVDSVRLVAQKLLLNVMTEYRQFRAFSKWLRVMIEVGIAGPGTKGATETEDREVPNLDYSLLLAYVRDTVSESKLAIHVEQARDMAGACSMKDFFTHPTIAQMSRKRTIEALEALAALRPGEKLTMKDVHDPLALVNLPAITTRLGAQVRLTIESITKWQSRMLPNPTTTPLITPLHVEANAKILDLRMFPHGDHVESVTDMLTTTPIGDSSDILNLYRVIRFCHSQKHDFTEAEFHILNGEIKHAILLDRKRCIVLFHRDNERRLLLLCDLEAYEVDRARWKNIIHVFASNFKAEHFVIGGRKGKMVCVVFSEGGKEWKVLDLNGHGVTNYDAQAEDEMQF